MNGICALCLNDDDLTLSHIVPRFVWRWLKETTPGGIRTNRIPNRRIQDGPKSHLLCAKCEQRLGSWEKPFCEELFLPLHDSVSARRPIRYEGWALRFAVSVSWRVLTYFKHESPNSQLTPLQQQLSDEALETWRRFLLGDIKSPGSFNQHLLPTDVIEDYQGPKLSSFLNRYLLRSVHIDVISTQDSAYVYTKMCRLVLFGRIHEKHPQYWKGMQLHLRQGDIRPRDYRLPEYIADYMNRKADEVKSKLESLSTKQHELIDAMFDENIDVIANSEVFRAMSYDVAHSGKDAFSKRENRG